MAAKKPRKTSSGLPEDAMDKPSQDGQTLADELGEQPVADVQPEGGPVRDRIDLANRVDLAPDSLCGSWFHRVENGDLIWDGVVVGEVQAGIYLLGITYGLEGATEETKVQVLCDLVTMVVKDAGYEYRFYDTREQMHDARRQYEALRQLREEVS